MVMLMHLCSRKRKSLTLLNHYWYKFVQNIQNKPTDNITVCCTKHPENRRSESLNNSGSDLVPLQMEEGRRAVGVAQRELL